MRKAVLLKNSLNNVGRNRGHRKKLKEKKRKEKKRSPSSSDASGGSVAHERSVAGTGKRVRVKKISLSVL